jgi:serine/threonine protein kinase
MFDNKALDNPFLAPENLFSKFQDHTSSMDVWGFGMVLYCLLLGKKPKSFYATYRDWYKKSHGIDLDEQDTATGNFIRPSKKNFIYDPFGFDFENPFNAASNVDPEISSELMD